MENRRNKIKVKFLIPFVGKRKVDRVRTGISVAGLLAIVILAAACMGPMGSTGSDSPVGGDTGTAGTTGTTETTGTETAVTTSKTVRSVTRYIFDENWNLLETIKSEKLPFEFPEDEVELAKTDAVKSAARAIDWGGGQTVTTVNDQDKKTYYTSKLLETSATLTSMVATLEADITSNGNSPGNYRFVHSIPVYPSSTALAADLASNNYPANPDQVVTFNYDVYAQASPQTLDGANGAAFPPGYGYALPGAFKSNDPTSSLFTQADYSFILTNSTNIGKNYKQAVELWRQHVFFIQIRKAYKYLHQFRGNRSLDGLPPYNPAINRDHNVDERSFVGRSPNIENFDNKHNVATALRTDIETVWTFPTPTVSGFSAGANWFLDHTIPQGDNIPSALGLMHQLKAIVGAPSQIGGGGLDAGGAATHYLLDTGVVFQTGSTSEFTTDEKPKDHFEHFLGTFIALNELCWRADLVSGNNGHEIIDEWD
jgi:hypothetical protein